MKAFNMFQFGVLLVCCFMFSSVIAQDDSPPSVEVSQGKIIGVTQSSISGRNFSAFMGIPYGEIPKRFERSVAARPWTGDLKATRITFKNICNQYEMLAIKGVTGTEDCLSLNVYTPRLQTSSDDALMPVMVFIHGGGFVSGFSLPIIYGPHHFMNKDVVLIVINYRVGFLGFLSTGDDAAQGNAGLWDQHLALEWVRDNIEVFGGDKNKVTIFGESAGAASVIYHLISPQSAGLFHRAIVQSGSALCAWALDEQPLDNALYLANQLNCSTQSTHDLVECLQTKDADDISAVTPMNFKIGPVVEVGSKEKFVPDHPYKMLQEGKLNRVPVIMGVVLDEAVIFFPFVQNYFVGTKDEFVKHGLKKTVGFFLDDDFAEGPLGNMQVYNEIVDVYFNDMERAETAIVGGIEFISDMNFNGCTNMTIGLLTAQEIPVFSYVYEYISNITTITTFTGKPDVPHITDLMYMFNPTVLKLQFMDEDLEFIDSFVTMWTKFAELGDPTPEGPVSWEPTPPNGNQFLRIGRDTRMDDNYIPERMAVGSKLDKAYLEYQFE